MKDIKERERVGGGRYKKIDKVPIYYNRHFQSILQQQDWTSLKNKAKA